MRYAIDVPPFEELSDPRLLAELAAAAERAGFDGFFLWDHIIYRPPVRAVADPWVALAAVACATSQMRIGPMITPLSRRRVQKLARETVTLDWLSGGRLTLGVGIGSDRHGELEPFGEVAEPRERARLLDQRLAALQSYWAGAFEPRPVQQPRIPVWVAAQWPHRRPLARAARFDGIFPIGLPDPGALAQLCAEVTDHRAAIAGTSPHGSTGLTAVQPPGAPFDVVVYLAPGTDPGPWERGGATWAVTDLGYHPTADEVRKVIAAGPG